MKYSELKKAAANVVKAGYVPFIRGLHGIGKSQMMIDIAELISEYLNKDVAFHEVDTSHIKEGELTGMPTAIKDKDTGNMINTYTLYSLFNEVIKEDAEGLVPIIFFDEINRTDRTVFNELMPIILNKRVQEVELPESLIILTAGNPESVTEYKDMSTDYSVLPMDMALKDRLFIFDLNVDPIEWLDWAIKKNENEEQNIDMDIIEFITEFPNMLHFITSSEINPTPRAWKMVSDVYKVLKKQGDFESFEDTFITIGGGKIGTDTTLNFVRFLKSSKNPLLKPANFFGVEENIFDINLSKLKSETPTRMYITMNNITEYFVDKLSKIKNKKKEKSDLINTYCKVLFVCTNDIVIGTLKDMKENNKKVLGEIVANDPKAIISVQKYLV